MEEYEYGEVILEEDNTDRGFLKYLLYEHYRWEVKDLQFYPEQAKIVDDVFADSEKLTEIKEAWSGEVDYENFGRIVADIINKENDADENVEHW